jgi:hypothetical protein
VQEVDVEARDRGLELRKAVESLLSRAPVVLLAPVRADLLEPRLGDALGPIVDELGIGPAGAGEALPQVVELGVGNLDREGGDLAHRVGDLRRGGSRRIGAGRAVAGAARGVAR